MRLLRLGFLLIAASLGASCGDQMAPPIDAQAEHIIPGDLGQSCGPSAGCFLVSDKLGGSCEQHCVAAGNWPGICTTRCNTDNDCGPAAMHCMETGAGRFCMAMTGDPNAGCPRPDANFMPDARAADAEP